MGKNKKKIVKKKKVVKVQRLPAKPSRVEIVVRQTPIIPTTDDLAQPMRDGKQLTVPKTWMSEAQIIRMVQKTPAAHVYKRKGRGGQSFDYVTGSYVEKVLNFVFGWNWDFDVVAHGREGEFIWVQGKLTVRGMKPGQSITKTQFGRSEVKYLRDKPHKPENYVDYGNDLKAATTDALKKCASLLGIASDIYGKGDYKAESGNDPVAPNVPPNYSKGENPTYEEPSVKEGEASPQFEDHVCQWLGKGGCGADLTKSEAEYSKRIYGRELCRNHYPKNK